MPSPIPKSPERRQRRNGPATVVQFYGPIKAIPGPPAGLLATTKANWRLFWQSPLAQVVEQDTDMFAIVRLFSLYDERERAYRAYRKQRFVMGSEGQQVMNPMGRAMQNFDAEIRQMEDRLGLTPRARLQLGIVMGAAVKTLSDLNKTLEEDEDGDDPRE